MKLVVQFFLLFILYSGFSQGNKDCILEKPLKSVNLDNSNSNTNSDYINIYKKIETYIPDENTPIKHIKIAVNIFTGPGTIQNTAASVNAVNDMIYYLNDFYTKLDSATYPIDGVETLTDTKIRFDLDGRIFFYEGTSLYNSSSMPALEKCIAGIDSARLDNLNIYLTDGGKAQAYAIPPNPGFILKGGGGYTASSLYGSQGVYISTIKPNYVNSQTLAHEIGHCLDLFHTYEPSCCHETCDGSDPEYLYDLFGKNPPEKCWEIGGFGCEITPGQNICTNNIMGGNNMLNYYFSPMQIGKMHRALSIKTVRKYVKDGAYNPAPHKINKSEIWNFDIRWYSDIVIEPGAVLTVTGKIYMAEQARIIVKHGASLCIDGGIVTSSGKEWLGVIVKGKIINVKQLLRAEGKVIYKNGGEIENAAK